MRIRSSFFIGCIFESCNNTINSPYIPGFKYVKLLISTNVTELHVCWDRYVVHVNILVEICMFSTGLKILAFYIEFSSLYYSSVAIHFGEIMSNYKHLRYMYVCIQSLGLLSIGIRWLLSS